MRSQNLPDRLCGLQRLVFEDPTLERATTRGAQRKVVGEIEEAMADVIAQRHAEDAIERRVNEKMAERHQEYVKDLKLEALRETGRPRNAVVASKTRKNWKRSRSASSPRRRWRSCVRNRCATSSAKNPRCARCSPRSVRRIRSTRFSTDRRASGKTTVARLALEVAKSRPYTPFAKDAPFVEASGTTLRWDPRETVNPLLGSVHDPIYQGSRREFADAGVPEPKLGSRNAGARRRAVSSTKSARWIRRCNRVCSKCSKINA